jgi:hypothetical protein
MILEKEILRGQDITSEQRENLDKLLVAVNKAMIVTSGYRSPEHNKAIGGAPNSNHCKCLAVDFADYDGTLKGFCRKNNYEVLIECGLWMEDGDRTPGWAHVQIVPTSKREFLP